MHDMAASMTHASGMILTGLIIRSPPCFFARPHQPVATTIIPVTKAKGAAE
jgi:hypothetical protein